MPVLVVRYSVEIKYLFEHCKTILSVVPVSLLLAGSCSPYCFPYLSRDLIVHRSNCRQTSLLTLRKCKWINFYSLWNNFRRGKQRSIRLNSFSIWSKIYLIYFVPKSDITKTFNSGLKFFSQYTAMFQIILWRDILKQWKEAFWLNFLF